MVQSIPQNQGVVGSSPAKSWFFLLLLVSILSTSSLGTTTSIFFVDFHFNKFHIELAINGPPQHSLSLCEVYEIKTITMSIPDSKIFFYQKDLFTFAAILNQERKESNKFFSLKMWGASQQLMQQQQEQIFFDSFPATVVVVIVIKLDEPILKKILKGLEQKKEAIQLNC